MLCAHRDRPRSRRAAERGYQLSPSDVDCPCDPPVGVMPMRWRDDTSVGRTRVFNYQDRARLILIQRLRRLGFSIEAIREYLSLYKADATGAAQYRVGLERITERIRELEGKRRDIDETLEGLRALEREAKERLDRALIKDAKRQQSKKSSGQRDVR